ncbi:hypothetical protein [Membranihabitans marinus]|uniref:hypothetical protein n=1 Tax=Membranihabitans marinus TaxID=1227546 RepID=UPI001F3ABF8F|nr:hypothetical protein [Membranihabitans marinus]
MANPEEIKKLKQSGWDDMEVLLDQHMPTKKRKIFPWYIAASLILLMGLGYYFLQPTSSPTIAVSNSEIAPTTTDSKELSTVENTDIIDINNSSASLSENRSEINESELKQPSINDDITNSPELGSSQIIPISTNTTISHNRDNALPVITETITKIEESIHTDVKNSNDYTSNHRGLYKNNKALALLTQDSDLKIGYNKLIDLHQLQINSLDHGEVKTKYFISAGDQLSSSNNIHYLQVSPGVSWTKSKWTAYLAAGLQLTAPSTKSINKENSPLFDQLDIENSKQLDFANSGGQTPSSAISNTTYYQKLRFNPGIHTAIGLAYALTPRWDIDWSVGHYWLTYNHEYKYIGTNAERIQVEQNNIKTNLSYSSLKLSYHLNSHIKIQLGTAFANIFKPKSGEWQLASSLAYTF